MKLCLLLLPPIQKGTNKWFDLFLCRQQYYKAVSSVVGARKKQEQRILGQKKEIVHCRA
jgi:hypothetical protein